MTDYKIIADNLKKINPPLEIPDGLTKDKWPYYLSYPYLNIYGNAPSGDDHDYSQDYLTFKIISDGTINWKEYINNEEAQEVDEYFRQIEYNKNDSGWVTITDNTELSVVASDTVQFRGNNNSYWYYDENEDAEYLTNFKESTAVFSVEGNIMSLIDSTNFTTATTLTNETTFTSLFNYCTGLTSAENLLLPATTLANECYYSMFEGCTSLTTAPALPATTLAEGCYCLMFNGCISLITAPELPATTLTNYCYNMMFQGCTSLTTVPLLPATTLAGSCYDSMFAGCSSLTTAPALPATTLADGCYGYMFSGCTSLTTAPELPATTLTNYCYREMFYGCTSLNYIKCLATDVSASNCTSNWVQGVASSGTFVKNSNMSNWTTGNNGISSGWTVQDAQ